MLGGDCRENGKVEYKDEKARKPAAALAHLDALLPLAKDSDAGVRRELILALRNLPTDLAGDALRSSLRRGTGRTAGILNAWSGPRTARANT